MKAEKLKVLQEEASNCTKCKLHSTRTNVVFGEGNPDAELVFIGEGPGQWEDHYGRPFVGRAGQLLENVIKAMGYTRDQVYIANVVKCRPPNNRDPEHDEVGACASYLHSQMGYIEPKVIVTLGRYASQFILKSATQISKLRGDWYSYTPLPWVEVAVMPTFHPAYILRNPQAKDILKADMLQVMKKLGRKP